MHQVQPQHGDAPLLQLFQRQVELFAYRQSKDLLSHLAVRVVIDPRLQDSRALCEYLEHSEPTCGNAVASSLGDQLHIIQNLTEFESLCWLIDGPFVVNLVGWKGAEVVIDSVFDLSSHLYSVDDDLLWHLFSGHFSVNKESDRREHVNLFRVSDAVVLCPFCDDRRLLGIPNYQHVLTLGWRLH